MRIRIPGSDLHIRALERVETSDTQYDIVDFGVEYGDGSIDSMVVGGSFATLKRLANKADESSLKKAKKRAKKAAKKRAAKEAPASPEVEVAPAAA